MKLAAAWTADAGSCDRFRGNGDCGELTKPAAEVTQPAAGPAARDRQ
jgi:hypothetical protein